MTRIRKLLLSFRARRINRLAHSDSMSFNAFCNDGPTDQFPVTKESSLSEKTSPKAGGTREYTKISPTNVPLSDCTRPSYVTVILVLMLSAVFLVLPIIYLLHCFGVIESTHNGHLTHTFALKDKEHYAPGPKVHENLAHSSAFRNSLPPPPRPDYSQCIMKEDERFDCHPQDGANKEACEARGCCWMAKNYNRKSKFKFLAPLDVPYCFYPSNYEGYNFANISETEFGLVGFLKRKYASTYPDDIETLKIVVKYETEERLRFRIVDPFSNRFEPPYPDVPIVDRPPTNLTYSFVYSVTNSGFKIVRKSDDTVIFDTMGLQTMIYSNQFIQISSLLPSKYIYGIGEHRSNIMLSTQWKRFTLFNHDTIPQMNSNLYGSHPFYLNIESSANAHGVFLLNSNAMDIILQPSPAITYRTIGGILDFYIMMGPSPAEVIRQYTEIIGKPFMPPYWSLGFHLCRFGYKSLTETKKVMQRTIDAGIPLDTQWNDLDYMNNSNDFTYDHINFKGLPQFITDLHKKGMHYIPLIDPGVSASEPRGTYPPFDEGNRIDIFVKNASGQPFIGKVWNKATTVWPDFTNPNAVDYWTLMLRSLHDQVAFDGAWIDMNEPANFLSGSFDGCPNSSLENPPYLPAINGGSLNYKTLCMTANHSVGLHYDVHNLYGFAEAIITNFALAEIRGKRPMIISRATFAGHGKFAGHWSGDVYSKWVDMRFSVPQLLSYSFFGVPMTGADICGFNGNTTAALCNRWSQLGAFYPFSRNHNTDDGIDQDPVAMGPEVVESTRKALTIRYTLLPYLYTLFWAAHVNGDTVARPLFFEHIDDPNTYGIDEQFLWGPALMIIPVLAEDRLWVNPYIPIGTWYDYYTLEQIVQTEGGRINISAPITTIPLLLKGGNIIVQQSALQTTTASRKTKLQILAAAHNFAASGRLYWDDGDSLNSVEERKYSLINFSLKEGELASSVEHWGPENPPNVSVVKVLGIPAVTNVTVNDMNPPFKYDTIHKYLLIENLDISLKNSIKISWKIMK